VARQDTGIVGKVEHCQISVFVGEAGRLGHALVDRALYVPAA
jgi:SRSO17 transposase